MLTARGVEIWLQQILDGAVEPLRYLLRPGERVFWLFALGSALLAAGVYLRRGDGSRPGLVRYLLSPHLWLHPSSRLDFRLVFVKALLGALVFIHLALSSQRIAVAVIDQLYAWFGARAPSETLSPRTIQLLYTACLFLVWDFSRYLLHRLLHTVPWLWQIHQVHHSAEVLTPVTLYRTHPVESVLFAWRGALVAGTMAGLFGYLFPGQAVQLELLGINALGFLFNLLGANLRHSHVWLSYGPRFERLLISPAQHQIHHSVQPEHHHKNFGTWLALWDRLGGSLCLATRRQRLRFGLDAAACNHRPDRLLSVLLGPLAALRPGAARRRT